LSAGKPIPEEFKEIIRKVSLKLNVNPANFSELLLTEYPPGSVINWHRDAPPFDIIAGISLNSNCIFKLRPHEKSLQNRTSIISVPVSRCSLYVIAGIARTNWQHSIAPVKTTRYSITLRTLRPTD
jgi:alkylated DNA repair dioxygenase AlkB